MSDTFKNEVFHNGGVNWQDFKHLFSEQKFLHPLPHPSIIFFNTRLQFENQFFGEKKSLWKSTLKLMFVFVYLQL